MENIIAIYDYDNNHMEDMYNWVLANGGTATYDPVMWILTIHTTRDGQPYELRYQSEQYLILNSAGEFWQLARNTFEYFYQPSA